MLRGIGSYPMGQVSGQCPEWSRRALVPVNKLSAPVPLAPEWVNNIDNPNTRRAFRNDVKEFMSLIALATPHDLRLISRSHEPAWREIPDQHKTKYKIRIPTSSAKQQPPQPPKENAHRPQPHPPTRPS